MIRLKTVLNKAITTIIAWWTTDSLERYLSTSKDAGELEHRLQQWERRQARRSHLYL